MENNTETIGQRIKGLRKSKGLTQTQLAQEIGVTDKAVSKWEVNDGNPDISLLPILARIFACSIDYLLTGSQSNEKVQVISRLEHCAKNDDPSLLGNLTYSMASLKDENNISLFDYVLKYKSINVFKAMIDSCKTQNAYKSFLKYRINAELFTWLIEIDREREVVRNLTRTSSEFRSFNNLSVGLLGTTNETRNRSNIHPDYEIIISYLVKNFINLTDDQKNYYFNLEGDGLLEIKQCFFAAYPYFIDYAYKFNKSLFKALMNRIPNADLWKQAKDDAVKIHQEDFFAKQYGFVYVLKDTLFSALDNHDYGNAKLLNKYVRRPLDEYEFNKEIVDRDSSLSIEEKNLKMINRGPIIVLSALLRLRNLENIKSVLNEGFLTFHEFLLSLIKHKKYKEVYKVFVDNHEISLAELMIDGKYDKVENIVIKHYPSTLEGKDKFNLKDFIYISKEMSGFIDYSDNRFITNRVYGKEEEYRQFILNKLINEIEREKLDEKLRNSVIDITERSVSDLINNGEVEIATIKLCKKLESILKSKYHFDGELSEMISNMTKLSNINLKDITILHKLREYRNSIAHPESAKTDIKADDLMQSIKIIFSL